MYYHLPRGEPGDRLRLEGHFLRNVTCDSGRRRVVCCAWWDAPHTNWLLDLLGRQISGFVVGDLQTGRWIGRFTQPEGADSDDEVYMSPDGHHFAAINGFNNGGTFEEEVLVYDLSSLPQNLGDLEMELGTDATGDRAAVQTMP